MIPNVDTVCGYTTIHLDTRRNEALRQAATAYVGAMLEAHMAGEPMRVMNDGRDLHPEEMMRIQKEIDFHLCDFLNAFSGAVYVPDMRAALTWDAPMRSINIEVWIP